jgi:hypothetical protein
MVFTVSANSGVLKTTANGKREQRHAFEESCHRRLAIGFWKRRRKRGRNGGPTVSVNACGRETTADGKHTRHHGGQQY